MLLWVAGYHQLIGLCLLSPTVMDVQAPSTSHAGGDGGHVLMATQSKQSKPAPQAQPGQGLKVVFRVKRLRDETPVEQLVLEAQAKKPKAMDLLSSQLELASLTTTETPVGEAQDR